MNDGHDDGTDVLEICEICRIYDEDVQRCIEDGCVIYLHRDCGAVCEACNQVVCDLHRKSHDDCVFCPGCEVEQLMAAVLEG